VTTPDLAFDLLDGKQVTADLADYLPVHAEVYGEPPHHWDAEREAWYQQRFAVQRRQPGFVLATARHGGFLVGYAFGLPLRPSTDWWKGLTVPLSDELTTEYSGRSFALADLLVRAAWRRQGIGAALGALTIAGRPEERAVAAVPSTAAPALGAFSKWGWHKVARKRDAGPGAPLLEVLTRPLPAGR
jgi:GNAT superfamily N-acetyltransferase